MAMNADRVAANRANLPKDSPIYPIKRINMKNSGNTHAAKVFNDYYDGSGNQEGVFMQSHGSGSQ